MIKNQPNGSTPANQSRWDGADAALGQKQATFEAIFNAFPAATLFTDLHGEIQLVNPAFTTLFGAPPQEVIGKPIDLLSMGMADEQAGGRFQPRGHTGDIATPVDVRYRAHDGGTFIGETVVTAVENGEGGVLGWLHLIRHISDRKHADALIEADLARLAKKHRYESIVSAVAHSVHQSTTLQAVLENAVDAMRTHIERIDAIEIFLCEGEEAVLKAHTGLPAWVIAQIQRLPFPQGYTWKVIRDGQPRYCADVDRDAFIHPTGRAFGVKSYVAMPIRAEGEFERLGGTHTITVNVRVIAATNRDLAMAVQTGSFRADLFYRLNVFPLTLPPLRERQEDIWLLVECFLARMAQKLGRAFKGLSDDSMDRLMRYAWPGNVRELQNVIERAAILAHGPVVEVDEALEQRLPPGDLPLAGANLQDVERAHILRVLAETHGIIEGSRGAARLLGLHPNTLRFRLQKLGIKHSRRRP